MPKRGAGSSVAANYVKTAKERQSNPVTETRQLTSSPAAAAKFIKDQLLTQPQCIAVAKSRHVEFLAVLLQEKGVEVYDQGQNVESLLNLCRMHDVPVHQTIDTNPELRCKNDAMFGAETCMQHTPPKTRAQIRSRLATLMPIAIQRAADILETSPQHGPVVALIKHVMDVNGFKPTEKLELEMNASHHVNPLSGFDLSQLSNQELQELITLMRKARPMEGALIKVKPGDITDITNTAEIALGNAVNITPTDC